MRRTATLAFLALAALPAAPASAQVPAPVAPPGMPAQPVRPAPGAPAIPVTPTAASPALPPPAIASAPPAQANPAAIPASLPGQPGTAQAGVGGVAAAVGGAVSALLEPAPAPKRAARDNEVELSRPDYKARLVACLEFRAGCNVRGLTRSDQDYLRYELKGQRYAGIMLDEIVEARMTQFGGDLTVIAPNAKGANPDWHSSLRAAPQGDAARARSGAYGMSRTEPQQVGGELVRTRHVPWPRQGGARSASADSRTDLD